MTAKNTFSAASQAIYGYIVNPPEWCPADDAYDRISSILNTLCVAITHEAKQNNLPSEHADNREQIKDTIRQARKIADDFHFANQVDQTLSRR